MSLKYSHLLTPLKVGNVILKNRILFGNALPHFLQGPENYPADPIISYYANIAKNGAAIITCWPAGNPGGAGGSRNSLPGDRGHMPIFEIEDKGVQNYLAQLVQAVHFHGSKANMCIRLNTPAGYDISERPKPQTGHRQTGRQTFRTWPVKEIPIEMMQAMIEDIVQQARRVQSLGFDGVNFHIAYHFSIFANSLSPATNKRTDQYGGSAENRARWCRELFQAIKKACGPDFLIVPQVCGEEDENGYTIDDFITYARLWEGLADILEIRYYPTRWSPSGFVPRWKDPITLRYARALKESGIRVIAAPMGGFHNPDMNEEYIATNKADMIGMGRAFICDPEYGKKLYEGRTEDIVPCIMCEKCHGVNLTGPWFSMCSVNPTLGMAERVNKMIESPGPVKKVAVIGGGPAGMEAAIVAAKRGHRVTLYERNDVLGGQLMHTDHASFKWPLKDFKDYLIRQVHKNGIEVQLNTEATPEIIKAKDYDAVLAAVGATPNVPDFPGAKENGVWMPIDVYGREAELGRRVVVIGGSSIGTETGMYLAANGHQVTVLTRQKDLATDAGQIQYIDGFRSAWESLDNFSYITGATTTSIAQGKVIYTDADGKEQNIETDSVVLAGGMNPRQDEALQFFGTADRFYTIGDCYSTGNIAQGSGVQLALRSAFAAASQL